ncbi:type II secretion system protein M [Henriciella mobilis]|uniref:type II secretion system protein M n=1 Tax=Henriciella mobilis TaxID=2305467 RepID=UPI000E673EB7|nr:type II secretion system protein M [Henriciella mobilis]RIJ14221.1 type II secretion system protein M [Henriciella mobilis]RIJ19947.1 type II secretion system protein M [Henriciella mobilis]
MSGWWQGLSAREKALIASAGGLLALVIIWYGMVAPLLSGRSDALQARQQAADELAQLEHLSAASRARSPVSTGIAVSTGSSLDADAFKTAVTRAAQQSGLSISRLQGGAQGRFSLVFEQADSRQLFYWLNEVETRLGGRVERFSIDQAGAGRVRATVEISGGEA